MDLVHHHFEINGAAAVDVGALRAVAQDAVRCFDARSVSRERIMALIAGVGLDHLPNDGRAAGGDEGKGRICGRGAIVA